MKPATLNVTIYQGSTFTKSFQWSTGSPAVAVDLTGFKIRMQMREKLSSPDPIIECNTDNGLITITNAAQGKFDIEIPAVTTSDMHFKAAVYDIEVVYPGLPEKVKRLIQGSVALSLEVTR